MTPTTGRAHASGQPSRRPSAASAAVDLARPSRGEAPDSSLLDVVESVARIGSYVLDIRAGSWTSSKGLDGILGIDAAFVRSVDGWASLVHPEDRDVMVAYFAEDVLGRGRAFDRQYRFVRRDIGETRWAHGRGELEFDATGQPIRMYGTIADITDQRAAEQAVQESETRFRATFEQAAVGIAHLALDGRWIRVNQRLCEITGYPREELLQMSFREVTHPDDLPSSLAAIAPLVSGALPTFSTERRYLRPDGTVIWVAVTASVVRTGDGTPAYLMSVTEDISERKRAEAERASLEAQLRQAQKMESVGRLAGGVAHDFNNMLGVILGNTEMALAALGPSHPLHADLLEVRDAAQRSADLTRQLLAFARRQTVAPVMLDLNATISGTLDMLRRLVGEGIELVWEPGDRLSPVRIDPSQIDQILVNLVVNAREAVGDIGNITIATTRSALDADYCAAHPGAVPGEYVALAVSDNGSGIDPVTMEHLFEPFFTTRAVGKGTGLGLSTVYGIVKQNEGFIDAYSEVGVGSTFRIYLPRHAGRAAAPAAGPDQPRERGTETVMIVEDEPSMLRLGRVMLERLGYRVLPAATPGEAIRMAREASGEIDLLMTDVVMPEMDGRALAKRLQSLFPDLRCLFMSGYTADVIAHHGVLDEGVQFLQKPFSSADLAAAVRVTLDGGSTAATPPGA